MWCANCQSDVATEISADGQSLKCTTCGHEIRRVFAPSLHPETQSARELLERWAREGQQAAKPATPTPEAESTEAQSKSDPVPAQFRTIEPPAPSGTDQGSTTDAAGARRGKPEKPFRPPVKLRIDEAHTGSAPRTPVKPTAPPIPPPLAASKPPEPVAAEAKAAANPTSPVAPAPPVQTSPLERSAPRLRIDAAHTEEEVPAPHVEIRPFAPRTGSRPGRAESLGGQLLAYLGVCGITVGTVFVVWGYFAGIESYASTGWLVATAGQMLLLLGVVTLISGGMQQTTHEVGARIETLDGRIHRIEQSTHQLLKGPYFSRKRKRSRDRSQMGPSSQTESA